MTARFPARVTKYEYTRLDGGSKATLNFPFTLDPSWKVDRLGVVVFVQDKKTGVIYQSAIVPGSRPRHAPRPRAWLIGSTKFTVVEDSRSQNINFI